MSSPSATSTCNKKSLGSRFRVFTDQEEILLNCADTETEQRMKDEVDKVLKTGDSLGGVFEVVAHGVPPGLGTYAQWDERLDALLAAAVMSLQAVKAVEIGSGITAAASPGSAVHDEIGYGEAGELHCDSPALATTPEESKAAFPTEKRSACAAI